MLKNYLLPKITKYQLDMKKCAKDLFPGCPFFV